jgi:hypothetical protein
MNTIVLATRSCARALLTNTKRKKTGKQRREAKRRKAHCSPIAACAAARLSSPPRPLARESQGRGPRPPSGAPPRHSPPAITPMAQPQTRVSAKTRRHGVLPARRKASLRSVRSVRTGPFAGRPVPQGRPGTVCETARGHPHSLRSQDRIRNAPFGERDSQMFVSAFVTNVKFLSPTRGLISSSPPGLSRRSMLRFRLLLRANRRTSRSTFHADSQHGLPGQARQ